MISPPRAPLVDMFLRHYFQHGRVFEAMLLVTHRCPLRCRHCYIRHAPRRELARNRWLRALDELAALGVLIATFSGGEPLLRRDLPALLRHADARGFALNLFTSGWGLTARRVAMFRDLRWREIAVSVYASDPRTHDAVTGVRGSWTQAVAALAALRAAGIPVAVNSVVLRGMRHCAPGVRAWTRREGYVLHQSGMVIPAFDGDRGPLQQRLGTLPAALRSRPQRTRAPRWRRGCGCGEGTVLIDAYGDVWPCTYFPLPLGNVRYAPLREVWNGSPLLPVIRRGLDRAASRLACRACSANRSCRHCYGQAFTEEGSVYRVPRVSCRFLGLTPRNDS